MHEDLIYEYATTENEEQAARLLGDIVTYYISLYDASYHQFSEQHEIEEENQHEQVRIDFIDHITEVLRNLRTRTETKKGEIFARYGTLLKTALADFVLAAYQTIEDSETPNAVMLAQLQAIFNLMDQNGNAIITKTWRAHPDCCPICAALNGLTVGINEYFLETGDEVTLEDGKIFVYDYNNREVPIAHPHDRCWIEFNINY